jgi:hypothetical protein
LQFVDSITTVVIDLGAQSKPSFGEAAAAARERQTSSASLLIPNKLDDNNNDNDGKLLDKTMSAKVLLERAHALYTSAYVTDVCLDVCCFFCS